jgi:hypothetical protein
MQTLHSDYRELRAITFPAFQGRQKYMHTFDTRDPHMPSGFEDYLRPVMELVESAQIRSGEVHVTIDEKIVKTGMSQRRPGPHVDGCFTGAAWSHTSGGWNHYCNNIPVLKRMAIIVAASASGCRVWRGTFTGDPQNDGDCSHFVTGESEVLSANKGFLLTPDCIHESMPFEQDTERQFLRIAFAV